MGQFDGISLGMPLKGVPVSGSKITRGDPVEIRELKEEIARLSEAFEYHRNESAKKSREIEKLKSELKEIRAVASLSKPRSGVDNSKAFNTVLKLCGGMAVAVYGFDPNDSRSRTVSEIQHDLDLKGIGMDADTIRKWLKESAKLLRDADKLN